MNTTQWAALYVFAVIAMGIVWLNVWYYRLRSKMTKQEREKEDAEAAKDLRIW